jgi:pilus assembly protein CpaF
VTAVAELDPIRSRLVALGRAHTAHDVAEAMRAEGRVVTDAGLLETVEALRRHSVGAGPLEPLLRQPGVTDVLVNGPDQVYLDRGEGLELTDVRFGSDAWTTRHPSSTPGWRTAAGCTPCSAPWRVPAPACRCACPRHAP